MNKQNSLTNIHVSQSVCKFITVCKLPLFLNHILIDQLYSYPHRVSIGGNTEGQPPLWCISVYAYWAVYMPCLLYVSQEVADV